MRPTVPATDGAAVVRTDFSDDAAWDRLLALMAQPQGDFVAEIEGVSDPAFDGVSPAEIVAGASADDHAFIFIADSQALSSSECAVVVADVQDGIDETFRVVPAHAWSVENNLSLGNLDFTDFLGAVDGDGVFRGFPEPESS